MEVLETTLVDEVRDRKKEFKTDNYSMSVGEITNLYKDNELIIRPDFQRLFRWSSLQKSRLIESILLGIPIPSIFVYQNDDGKWELVDGLQRISTILEFMGILKDEKGIELPASVLQATEYLPNLENIAWESLDQILKLEIKRAKFKVEIIQNESDKDAKFEIFQRLNTGGSLLSQQEVRNALLVLKNRDFYFWFEDLCKDENFQSCIDLTENSISAQYDKELALRFLVYGRFQYTQSEISEFLTDSLKKLTDDKSFDFGREAFIFKKTFQFLRESLDNPEDAFKKYDSERNIFKGKFLESAYEAIAIGLASNIESYQMPDDKDVLSNKIKNIWKEEDFISKMGSGSNAKSRLPKTIRFGKAYFAK